MNRKAEGITFQYDQQDQPAGGGRIWPGQDLDKESPNAPGNTDFGMEEDGLDPSSAKVIPDSMGETLREQLTYPITARVVSRYAAQPFVLRPAGWGALSDEADARLREMNKPGHVYRGMTSQEYRATLGAGKPIQSTGKWSLPEEGTNFADDMGDAESYVNFGRTDPRKTGKPTYIVEVKRSEDMKRWRDGYIKTPQPVPPSQVTRVWKNEGEGDELVMTRIASGMVTLPRGSVVYHGTPYGKQFAHPSGPSWFTPDRDTATFYTHSSWKGRARDFAENAELSPSVRKYRLKKDLRLPFVERDNVAELLGQYGAKAGLGTVAELEDAISDLGIDSATSWSYIEDDGTSPKLHELADQFGDVTEYLDFLCTKGFPGWVAAYSDGGTEVMLCDPSSVLKASARQPAFRNKKDIQRERLKEEAQVAKYQDQRDAREKAKAEAARVQAEEDKFWDEKEIVMSYFWPSQWDKPDYSDPKVRGLVENWKKYITPQDMRNHGPMNPSPARVAARSLPQLRTAATISELLQNTGPKILSRAQSVKIKPKKFDRHQGFWSWTATGSKGEQYLVRIKGWTRKEKGKGDLSKVQVRCSCTCNFWRWQGPEHWAKVNKYLYKSWRAKPQGTMSKPVIRDPKGKHWVCKHVAAALERARKFKFASENSWSLDGELVPYNFDPDPMRVAARFQE